MISVENWISYLRYVRHTWPSDWHVDDLLIKVNGSPVNSAVDFDPGYYQKTFKSTASVDIECGDIYTSNERIRSIYYDYVIWVAENITPNVVTEGEVNNLLNSLNRLGVHNNTYIARELLKKYEFTRKR